MSASTRANRTRSGWNECGGGISNYCYSRSSRSETNLDDTGSFQPRYINDICSGSSKKTSIIRLGTSIVPTYPRHPLALAQQVLAINDIAPGRFRLGIGPSHRPIIEGVYGLSQTTPLVHLREYLQVLRAVLWEGKVNHHGHFFNVVATMSTVQQRFHC